MNEQQIEIRAAKTILQKGVRVPLVTPPLLFRMFGKRTMSVTIRQPSMDGEIMIAALISEMNLSPEMFDDFNIARCYDLIRKHGRKCMEIIAISILRWPPFIYGYKRYARWLAKRIEPHLVAYTLQLILALGDVESFTSSIRSMTEKVNILSPRIQGSQKTDESPASIAPGE